MALHLPSAPWWPELVHRGVVLDTPIHVYQPVQDKTLWAHEGTLLPFAHTVLTDIYTKLYGETVAASLISSHRASTTAQYERC